MQKIIHTVVKHGSDSRALLKQGIDLVANTISPTLGAKAGNVIVHSEDGNPRSMNDGYYISDLLSHDDKTINAGIKMVRDICKKTNDIAGDGTTSTSVVIKELIDRAEEEMTEGKHPTTIKKELEKDLSICLEEIQNNKKEISTNEEIKNVATIAANNDEEIGNSIAKIYDKLGNNAAIMVEKGVEEKIKEEIVEGIYFDTGYGEAKGFINNPRKMTAEYEDVKVLCLDFGMSNFDWMISFLTKCIEDLKAKNKLSWDLKLLIICREFSPEGQTYPFLVQNSTMMNRRAVSNQAETKGAPLGFGCVCVEAPHSYGNQTDILEDIAIATGAKLVGDRTGLCLRDVGVEVLGSAKKIEVSRNSTMIIGGQGDDTELSTHLLKLKGQYEEAKQEYKEGLEKRIKSLESGVGILKVGGTTDIERTERGIRVEDAVQATKQAVDGGIVVGGGVIYKTLSDKCLNRPLKEACKKIGYQIQLNSGVNDITEIKGNIGYNAFTDKVEDLEKAGVIEPANVVKTVLENAVSFSGLFINTCGSIVEQEEIIE